MKKLSYFLPAIAVLSFAWMPQHTLAQDQDTAQDQQEQYQEIIIRRKADGPKKMTVQINGDKVLINGKKPEELKNQDVTVIQRKVTEGEDALGYGSNSFTLPRGGTQQFNYLFGDTSNNNKALLGVFTEESAGDGALVADVGAGTAADKGGIKQGDVITKVDDQVIHTPEDLVDAIGSYKPEDSVTVTYKRDGTAHTTTVTLGKNGAVPFSGFSIPQRWNRNFRGFPRTNPYHGQPFSYHGEPFVFGWMNDGAPRLGMTVQDRKEGGQGVEVVSVLPGSLAEKAGFQKGDVITQFDGQSIDKAEDVVDALKADKDKDTATATIQRDGKTRTLTVHFSHPEQTIDL